MEKAIKISLLKSILEKTNSITVEKSADPDFKVWKSYAEKKLISIFGENSLELKDFKTLNFYYRPSYTVGDIDYSSDHLRCFRRDLITAKKFITSYIEDLEENIQDFNQKDTNNSVESKKGINKVFISHASADKNYVEEIIDILETIGLKNEQIFCSSFEGYGIELGENFLQRIKDELNENILVLFVLSENFYKSPICLCEMGATWIKTNKHIPILIPPFDFEDVKGVIPMTQGLKINERLKLNSLKKDIEKHFDLVPIEPSSWERRRDRIIGRIDKFISTS